MKRRSFEFNRSYSSIFDILLAFVLPSWILPYDVSISSALACSFVELSSELYSAVPVNFLSLLDQPFVLQYLF